MSKKTENPVDEQQQEQTAVSAASPADNQPAFLKELQEKGTAIVTATSREELNEMVNGIPAEVTYGVGAVGYNAETRLYTLRIDLTNK